MAVASVVSSFDVTAALTLCIPQEFADKINEVRRIHDKAYPRWMPHVNFLFPFVEEKDFAPAIQVLTDVLNGFSPFELNLNEIGSFPQGKIKTVHVKAVDETKIKELYARIRTVLPNVQVKHDDFHAHMTIAQVAKSGSDKQIQEFKQWLGSGFKFVVDRIYIIKRSKENGSDPFVVAHEIPFGA